jgi:hypothetical protein
LKYAALPQTMMLPIGVCRIRFFQLDVISDFLAPNPPDLVPDPASRLFWITVISGFRYFSDTEKSDGSDAFRTVGPNGQITLELAHCCIEYLATVEGAMKNYISLRLKSSAFRNLLCPGFWLIRIIRIWQNRMLPDSALSGGTGFQTQILAHPKLPKQKAYGV